MKEFLYYAACVLTWIVTALFLSFLFVIVSGVNTSVVGWSYALGTGFGQPSIWIVALGVVLLLREKLCSSIMNENKEFSKKLPVALIIIGGIWLVVSTFSQIQIRKMQQDIYEKYYNSTSMIY